MAVFFEKLNISNGVIRSRELALATEEGMSAALRKQGVTNIKRIFVSKGEEKIETNTYIMTFNQPPHSQRGEDRLLCRDGRTVCPSSTEVLQMPKVWTPQRNMWRMTHMCQMW